MTWDTAALLEGPRGRRVCLEYARLCAERGGHAEATTALWWAGRRLDPDQPMVVRFSAHYGTTAAPDPVVTPADAAPALDAISLVPPTADDLRTALAASVGRAMYWQSPDGDDALAATEDVRGALARVADVIASSPHAAWWETPVDLDDQWTVPWEGGGGAPADAEALLASWRDSVLEDEERAARERPADPHANWTGMWWSIPRPGLVPTTRSLADDGPARLWFEEDSAGGTEATAVPVEVYPARVIEIDGVDAWADLCRRHPLDVSASRRQDWFRTTGRDGRWVLPDWSRVAAEADGVHLTVAGYLAAAGRAIEVGPDTASVIAGWNPDETYWFRGTIARPAGEQRWVRVDDQWRRAG